MNDDRSLEPPAMDSPPETSENRTIWTSSIFRVCEELIALRELNNRQHKLFEQTLARSRDALQDSFNVFAADTQRAYQQLRQEMQGEKRASLSLLNELLDIAFDLERIVGARPLSERVESESAERQVSSAEEGASRSALGAFSQWAQAVEVECRKVQDALRRHGIHPYDAINGSAYNPAIHERVGSKRVEGMDAYRVAEQVEHGYASQQPEFVLRRAKVIISE